MIYRDYMQRFRPLYAPDGVDGGAGSDTGAAAAGAGAAPAGDAAAPNPAATATPAADGVAVATDPSAAVDAAKTDSAPTLLEAASGKKEDAKPSDDGAAKASDAAGDKKDEPAPADAAKTDAKTDADKTAEAAAKDKDAKTDPDAKDATAEAQPPAPIKYEAFKVPDGVKLDDKELSKFTELAGKSQIPQDVAQGLVDLYVAERQNDAALARAEQRKVWDTLNDTWRTELRNHPELGGNRLETTLSLAKAVVEEYLPADKVGEYMAHMRNNGMGNYLLHVQLLHNIGKAMNVFEDGIVPANPQAPKAQKGPGNRGWYPTMNGQAPQ